MNAVLMDKAGRVTRPYLGQQESEKTCAVVF